MVTTSPYSHDEAVSQVSTKVKYYHDNNIKFRIYHGTTNTTRSDSQRSASSSVNLKEFNHILSISPTSAVVEPNVPFDQLVQATLKQGFIPPVVPEFPGITVGGAFAGTAGESSSYKWGFVDATVLEIEVVLGDGTIQHAKRGDELFKAVAGTLGTIGVVTKLEIQLVQAKPYVEVKYWAVGSFGDATAKIEEEMAKTENEFLDCIMYSRTKGAIITGRMVEEPAGKKLQTFTKRRDPWFYMHAESMISKTPATKPPTSTSTKQSNPGDTSSTSSANVTTPITQPAHIDHVPITDYFFRYDRAGFWVGRFPFDYFSLPFIKPIRTLMDTYLHTRSMYHALHVSGQQQLYLIEDIAVPVPRAPAFLETIHEDLGIYPLWLCPLKFRETGLRIRHFPADTDILLNIGIWGAVPKGSTYRDANRQLEARVRDYDGVKWLYAQMFYTREEFWEVFDREKYEGYRREYAAGTSMPDVYDKIRAPATNPWSKEEIAKLPRGERWKKKVISFWVFPGLYGVYKVWRGKDYLLKKEKS